MRRLLTLLLLVPLATPAVAVNYLSTNEFQDTSICVKLGAKNLSKLSPAGFSRAAEWCDSGDSNQVCVTAYRAKVVEYAETPILVSIEDAEPSDPLVPICDGLDAGGCVDAMVLHGYVLMAGGSGGNPPAPKLPDPEECKAKIRGHGVLYFAGLVDDGVSQVYRRRQKRRQREAGGGGGGGRARP